MAGVRFLSTLSPAPRHLVDADFQGVEMVCERPAAAFGERGGRSHTTSNLSAY